MVGSAHPTRDSFASCQHSLLDVLKWTDDGLIPAIVQDAETDAVLMMAWMDAEAVEKTLRTGQTHFYSRSRRQSWHKGGTSGHVQHVEEIRVDCDADVLLDPGPTGRRRLPRGVSVVLLPPGGGRRVAGG